MLRSERIRNVGVLAHVDAGKTTLSERLLYFTGRIRKVGEVHQGTTTLDFGAEERRHGITITSAATSVTWRDHLLNLIDTPGHVDFSVEVERSLRILDGAVVVLDAANGVEPQTEAVWRKADALQVPRLVFINKMDRVGADLDACVRSLRERLGAVPLVLQRPLGTEAGFHGVVNLITLQAVSFDADGVPTGALVPEGAVAARKALVEALAQLDDQVLERFVATGDAEVAVLEAAVRRVTCAGRAVPVLCGSAYKNRGVQPVLDAVVAYLPSPVDRGGTAEKRLSAVAAKLVVDQHFGTLAWVRVYSGALAPGTVVLNPRTGRTLRVGRVGRVHAATFTDVDALHAGDIGAVTGLSETKTGDTLCDPDAPVELMPMEFSEPLVELALEPKNREHQQRLAERLRVMVEEDPTLKTTVEAETGRVVLRGMGELHLSICLEKLKNLGIEVRASAPRVSYRETIRERATVTHRHKKQGGGPGQFAQVTLEVVPLERDAGNRFVDAVRSGAVPGEFVPGVEKGVRSALSRGALEAGPMVDVEVRLVDGLSHSNDSSALAFEIAASMGCQQALLQARPCRLEPVMAVEVTVPEAFVGAVLGDVASRRGRVQSMTARGNAMVVQALVPLAELFGYVDALRSRSEGRGTVSMKPSHYDVAP